jgi:hypothetical protein
VTAQALVDQGLRLKRRKNPPFSGASTVGKRPHKFRYLNPHKANRRSLPDVGRQAQFPLPSKYLPLLLHKIRCFGIREVRAQNPLPSIPNRRRYRQERAPERRLRPGKTLVKRFPGRSAQKTLPRTASSHRNHYLQRLVCTTGSNARAQDRLAERLETPRIQPLRSLNFSAVSRYTQRNILCKASFLRRGWLVYLKRKPNPPTNTRRRHQ